MKTRDILILAGLGIAGFAIWQFMKAPAGIPPGATMVPPGGSYGGFQNYGNQPKWITTTGAVLGIVNGLATTLGSLPWSQWFPGSNTGSYTGGNMNPDSGMGTWVDEGYGLVWKPYA